MGKGNFLFKQERIGQYGKKFKIYKIRTMVSDQDEDKDQGKDQGKDEGKGEDQDNGLGDGNYITTANDVRVLPFGRWLRRTKFDEIVELINVLKGDMSLVGPRPDVSGYADILVGEERKILELRPGITGPASLKYINEEEILANVENPQQYNDEVIYPDKVKINLDYYYNRSFIKDIKIIFKTILH